MRKELYDKKKYPDKSTNAAEGGKKAEIKDELAKCMASSSAPQPPAGRAAAKLTKAGIPEREAKLIGKDDSFPEK